MLQLLEIVVTFPSFLGRRKLPIVFHKLLKTSPVDKHHSRDVDIFRFHLPERVQPAILVALSISVMVTHRLTAFGGHDGGAEDLRGIRDACISLRCFRPARLGEERGRSYQP